MGTIPEGRYVFSSPVHNGFYVDVKKEDGTTYLYIGSEKMEIHTIGPEGNDVWEISYIQYEEQCEGKLTKVP